jgi:hypothetical protein
VISFPKALTEMFVTWLLARLQRSSGLTEEERRQLGTAARFQRVGALETFVQSGWVMASSHGETKCQHLHLPTLFLQRTGSTCMARAIAQALPELAPDGLKSKVAPYLAFAWTLWTMDSAAANVRMFHDIAAGTGATTFHLLLRCLWHQIFRPFISSLEMWGCPSPLFSLNCLLRQCDYYYDWVASVFSIVQRELALVLRYTRQVVRALGTFGVFRGSTCMQSGFEGCACTVGAFWGCRRSRSLAPAPALPPLPHPLPLRLPPPPPPSPHPAPSPPPPVTPPPAPSPAPLRGHVGGDVLGSAGGSMGHLRRFVAQPHRLADSRADPGPHFTGRGRRGSMSSVLAHCC